VTDEQPLDPRLVPRTVLALRLVFLGGLLCLLDFNLFIQLGSRRSSVDLLNDLVGVGLVAVGVGILYSFEVDRAYDVLMTVVFAAAGLSLIAAVAVRVRPELRDRAEISARILQLLFLLAIALFPVAMRRLARHARLERSALVWTRAIHFFIWLLVVPMLAAQVAVLLLRPPPIWLMPLLLLYAVPMGFLFYAASVMKREATQRTPVARASRGMV